MVLRAAYWKYAARRRLTGEKRGSFVLPGSNFFERPQGDPSEAAWKADIALLLNEHNELRQSISRLSAASQTVAKTAHLIRGVAAHDLYHAGQIRLLRRLWEAKLAPRQQSRTEPPVLR